MLRNAVAKYGTREWGKIKAEVPGRTDSACRDRYDTFQKKYIYALQLMFQNNVPEIISTHKSNLLD